MVISEQWSDCEMIRQPFPTYRQLHLIRPIKLYISIDEFIIIITVWNGGAKITGGGTNIRDAGAQLRWALPYFHHWLQGLEIAVHSGNGSHLATREFKF